MAAAGSTAPYLLTSSMSMGIEYAEIAPPTAHAMVSMSTALAA